MKRLWLLFLFRANREFAQSQDCPAQTRNSNFAAQSWNCADRISASMRRMRPGATTCTVVTSTVLCAAKKLEFLVCAGQLTLSKFPVCAEHNPG